MARSFAARGPASSAGKAMGGAAGAHRLRRAGTAGHRTTSSVLGEASYAWHDGPSLVLALWKTQALPGPAANVTRAALAQGAVSRAPNAHGGCILQDRCENRPGWTDEVTIVESPERL